MQEFLIWTTNVSLVCLDKKGLVPGCERKLVLKEYCNCAERHCFPENADSCFHGDGYLNVLVLTEGKNTTKTLSF